jgi:ubiquinone/menaquinone biosynthesis C-methylase UbiE
MVFAWCPPEDSPLLGAPLAPEEPKVVGELNTEQEDVTRRYDRMARFYDLYDAPMEWMGTRRRRRRLVAQLEGRVLEAGVGTGKNIPYYPEDVEVTGIDVSAKMLARAERRARVLGREVSFELADVTDLPYPDGSFDTTVATTVFCSVADPVAGLRELGRVTKPNGRILLLEHVRPRNRVGGLFADVASILTRRIFGFNANRRTEENVRAAGLVVTDVKREGIWRTIVAVPPVVMSETNEQKT